MDLVLRNKSVLKYYILEYNEKRTLNGEVLEEIRKNIKIAIEYFGKNITFTILSSIKGQSSDEYTKILELAEQSFDNLKFTIDSTGKINKLRNLDEIASKWNDTKREHFSNIRDKYIKNFIFEISKIISTEQKITVMVKEYNIIPYIFMGLYNQQYSENFPVRINTDLYNIFSLMKIPVILELYGKEYPNDERMIAFKGKEAHDFDRFAYMNTFEKKYPILKNYRGENFNININGLYLYNIVDNLLSCFKIDILVDVRKKFKGEITYTLKEEK